MSKSKSPVLPCFFAGLVVRRHDIEGNVFHFIAAHRANTIDLYNHTYIHTIVSYDSRINHEYYHEYYDDYYDDYYLKQLSKYDSSTT